jgi:hypothetical protein
VMTYVASYKLFWNWIGVVRFVSHEVWFDQGFVIWHFFLCFFFGIVSLWSLITSMQSIFNINELVNPTRHWNRMPHRQDFWWNKMQRRKDFFVKRMRSKQNLCKKRFCWQNPDTYSNMLMWYVNRYSQTTGQNLLSLINQWINELMI